MSNSENPVPSHGIRDRARASVRALLADDVLVCFFASLCVLFIWYRVRLFTTLFSSPQPPFGVEPNMAHALAMTKCLASDLLVAAALGAICYGVRWFFNKRLGFIARTRLFRVFEAAAWMAVLLVTAFLMLVHQRLVFEIESGLNMMLLQVGATELGRKDALRLMTAGDIAFLLSPVLAYVAFRMLPQTGRIMIRAVLPVAAIIAVLAWLQPWIPRLAPQLIENPLYYLGRDALRAPLQFYTGRRNPFLNQHDIPGPAQMNSIRLVDDAFVFTNAPGKPPLLKPLTRVENPAHWNVLFLIMESTGADYVFDTSLGNEIPMPFLREMANKGLYFANNHTACNSSGNALMSILSGLYPRPTSEVFSHLNNASIPLVNQYLRATHSSFLVHPSSRTYSFPAKLFENSRIDEIYYYEKLPKGPGEEFIPVARNELDVVSFLLDKLDTVREPFCGVYWSFIPHHPYSDYGPESHILPNVNDKRQRYYNNLRVLDTQLRRIYDHLRERGLLERTILVFVGDHGEGFGQHPGMWAHISGCYSETYRAPVIFYQPRIIEPRAVTRVTSHVDILPTLFDLMGVDWDENKFQGESALRESRRRYIFSMDCLADYMSVVDTNMNKVSICFLNGNVLAFNLAKDPGEKLPMNEDPFGTQLEAIVKFRNYQTHLINAYNTAILDGKEFP